MTPTTFVELLAHIAEIILVVGLLVAWRQYRDEHDRARREKAIEYILTWVKGLDRRATLARKLVESLNFHTCKKVFDQEAFFLDDSYGALLEGVFDGLELRAGRYEIDPGKSAELRWLIVGYLNNLEAIMSARLHNVADRDIIASQFRFLISPKKGHYILQHFRQAAEGPVNYPGIEAYVQDIIRETRPAGKPAI